MMSMVVGVDTHKETHSAALLNELGVVQDGLEAAASAITRARCDAQTQAYIARRISEGKSAREIRRCLKRYLARRIFKLLENLDKT